MPPQIYEDRTAFCLHTLMYTIHTCALTCSNTSYTHYTPAVAVVGTSWASWRVHSPLLSPAGERLVAAEVLLLFETGLWGNFCWEGELWVSLGQAKYSAGVMHSCGGCKAAYYLHKLLKTFDGSGLGVSPPRKFWEFRAHLLAIYVAVSQGTNQKYLLSDEYYSLETKSSGPLDLHKE